MKQQNTTNNNKKEEFTVWSAISMGTAGILLVWIVINIVHDFLVNGWIAIQNGYMWIKYKLWGTTYAVIPDVDWLIPWQWSYLLMGVTLFILGVLMDPTNKDKSLDADSS